MQYKSGEICTPQNHEIRVSGTFHVNTVAHSFHRLPDNWRVNHKEQREKTKRNLLTGNKGMARKILQCIDC